MFLLTLKSLFVVDMPIEKELPVVVPVEILPLALKDKEGFIPLKPMEPPIVIPTVLDWELEEPMVMLVDDEPLSVEGYAASRWMLPLPTRSIEV